MATIKRLTDSCLHVITDDHATIFDPGFHTFQTDVIDLDTIGDVTRVFVSHEHMDHVNPDFLAFLIDRRKDLAVYANEAVGDLLAKHDIAVDHGSPGGASFEDVLHGRLPTGAQPPNRAYSIDGLVTHPGDSREPTKTEPVLALPLIVPWDSATGAVDHARRLQPAHVVPIHDFYLNDMGRGWIRGFLKGVLANEGIDLIDIDWGGSFTY